VAVKPAAINFSAKKVGKVSAAKAIKLVNQGAAAVTINAMGVSGDFRISSSTCERSIAPLKSCKIAVRFAPGAVGARSGAINVIDDAMNSPQTVQLSGSGK
jgi:hypothetical protein